MIRWQANIIIHFLAFNIREIRCFHVPWYKELWIKKLYPKLKEDEKILKYLPDYGESELLDREFFFSIVSTLYPNEMQFLIKKIRADRSVEVENDKDEMIEVSQDMKIELDNLLVHPSKFIFDNFCNIATPGKGVFLLKAKAKPHKKRTMPKEYYADLDLFFLPQNANQRVKKKPNNPMRDLGDRLNDDMNVDRDERRFEEDKHNQ